MKQKIIILLSLVITLEMTVIILLINNQKDFNRLYLEKNEELNNVKYKMERYLEKFEQNIFTENTTLKNITVTDYKGNKNPIVEIVDGKKLVYRFSEVSCRACVDMDIEILKQLGDSIGHNNIMVISKFDNLTRMNAMLNAKNFNSPYFNYNGKLGLSVEKDTLTEPGFFFLIDNNLRISFAYKTDDAHNFYSPYFRRIIEHFKNGV